MTGEHIPELLLSEELNAKVNEHGILAWFVLFEILFDPEPDDVFKHEFSTLGGTTI